MNSTTNKERYLLLDQITGWREGLREHLALTAEGNFTLDPLPGGSEPLFDAEQEAALFGMPSSLALAFSHCGGGSNKQLFVTDIETHEVKQIDLGNLLTVDPKTGEIKRADGSRATQTIPTIGGEGSAPRRLRKPRGIAVLPTGEIVIADTANHRVQIFSSAPYALLQVWGATDGLNHTVAGKGRKEFSYPWDVAADDCGNVYVADRGNQRIQKIASDGTWLEEKGTRYLSDPTRIALSADGLLAVVDQQDASSVLVFSPHCEEPARLAINSNARSVTFDDEGRIYVGDDIGLIHSLAPDAASPGGYRLVGTGSTNLVGEVIDLTWHRAYGLLAVIWEQNDECITTQRLWRINSAGFFANEGRLVTTVLDSEIEECQWDRILLNAALPKQTDGTEPNGLSTAESNLGGASLKIESFTSDALLKDDKGKPDAKRFPDDSADWKLCLLAGDSNPDCLVQSGRGRYLWLRFTFRSNGLASPVLRNAKVFFPRAGYLQYLPAVYQEDEESRYFLERFLAIFQSEFDHLDEVIDNLWQSFDPASVSEQHFNWLGAWLALKVDPEWPLLKRRQMLKRAFKDYLRRGTVDGFEQAVKDYAGVQFARVLEHYKLRRLPVLHAAEAGGTASSDNPVGAALDGSIRLWSRDFYRRLQLDAYSQIGRFKLTSTPEPALELLSQGAHRFTVFFPASPYKVDEITQKVKQVVAREKPAHTEAEFCPVLPRLRVGVQATLGMDTTVGGVSHLVLNSLSTLSYDTILACSAQEHQLRNRGSSSRLQTGVTTKLS